MKYIILILTMLLAGCTGIPERLSAVEGVELERYLGRWYEIARLDHSFERGLSNVSATYSWREDGGIRVVNRGYDATTGEWQEAVGKAYAIERPDIGRLKVAFFGPFYGGYNIIALDKENYGYALVCGPDRSYLWILARSPRLDAAVLQELLRQAREWGFATEQLIMVAHDQPEDEARQGGQ